MATPQSKSEQRRERMQTSIIKSAAKQFSKYGYAGVSVDMLAHAAKISKRTLYKHFGNKQKLYIKSTAWYIDQALAHTIIEGDTEEQLREYFKWLFLLMEKDVVFRKLLIHLLTDSDPKTTAIISSSALKNPIDTLTQLINQHRPDKKAVHYAYAIFSIALLHEEWKKVVATLTPDFVFSPEKERGIALLMEILD